MEGASAFLVALGLVAFLELGDKTQLLLISLGTKHPPLPVIAGAALGMAGVTAIGVGIGVAIAQAAPLLWIQIASGVLFIGFGAWQLIGKEEEEDAEPEKTTRGPFATALVLSFIAELGDKTMITVIALAGSLQAPASVFLGAALALAAVAVLSVALGRVLRRYITAKWLRWLSAGLFIAAGVITIVEALVSG